MSTETAPQNRGGLKRHRKAHLGSGSHGARTGAGEALRTCGCGCGEPVSPLARFKVGHYRANAPHEARTCVACGRIFKVVSTAARTVCKDRNCQGSPTWSKEISQTSAERDSRLRETLQGLRSTWTREERRIVAARRAVYRRRYYERDEPLRREARDQRLRQIDATIKRNADERERQTDGWLDSLTLAERAAALELLADQKRDERSQQAQWEQSLDRTFEDGQPMSHHSGTVYFDRESDMWPYTAERGRRGANIRKIVRRRYLAGDVDYIGKEIAASKRRSAKANKAVAS